MTTPWTALYSQHLQAVRRRADHALERAGAGSLAIHSGSPPMLFLDDQSYPFKVNPHFKAWVPVTDNPDCILFHVPGAKPVLLFNQPVDYWHKSAALPDAYWVREFDLRPVPSLADARAHLPSSLADAAFVGEMTPELASWGFGHTNPRALLDSLHYARAAKTPYEVACLYEAQRRAAHGHRAAERTFRDGGSEYDAHMAYLAACGQREEEMPYNNIVAYNGNAAVLHYQHLERKAPPERKSFLIDAGASHHGYASDITRTHSARPDEFARLVQRFEAMQLELCAAVKPGTDWREFQMLAHRKIAGVLREADVIKVDAQAAVDSGLSAVFFPHGIGHLLGLQVHDVGGFMRDEAGGTIAKPEGQASLRLTRKLEPGFVVTVEPGMYFIDQLLDKARTGPLGRDINWQRVDSLRPYGGIRVEDDVLVSETGHRNLTREAFAATA